MHVSTSIYWNTQSISGRTRISGTRVRQMRDKWYIILTRAVVTISVGLTQAHPNYHPHIWITHENWKSNHISAVFMPKQISVSQGASGVTFLLRYQERQYPHWSRFLGTNATKPLLVLQGSKLPLTDPTACKSFFVVAFLAKFCRLMEVHDPVTIMYT